MKILFLTIFVGAVDRISKNISSFVELYEYVEVHDGSETGFFVYMYIVIFYFRTIFSVVADRLARKKNCVLDLTSMCETCVHMGNKLWCVCTKSKEVAVVSHSFKYM